MPVEARSRPRARGAGDAPRSTCRRSTARRWTASRCAPRTRPARCRCHSGSRREARRSAGSLEPGEAMGIATGGVVPDGADAVIPLEYVVDHDNTIEVAGGRRARARTSGPPAATCVGERSWSRPAPASVRPRWLLSRRPASPRLASRGGRAPPSSPRGASSAVRASRSSQDRSTRRTASSSRPSSRRPGRRSSG